MRESPCHDCGIDTTPCTGKHGCRHAGKWEYYSVHNAVWEKAVPDDDTPIFRLLLRSEAHYFLCIGCLERRLGRELSAADFPDCIINDEHPWNTPRLADRLRR